MLNLDLVIFYPLKAMLNRTVNQRDSRVYCAIKWWITSTRHISLDRLDCIGFSSCYVFNCLKEKPPNNPRRRKKSTGAVRNSSWKHVRRAQEISWDWTLGFMLLGRSCAHMLEKFSFIDSFLSARSNCLCVLVTLGGEVWRWKGWRMMSPLLEWFIIIEKCLLLIFHLPVNIFPLNSVLKYVMDQMWWIKPLTLKTSDLEKRSRFKDNPNDSPKQQQKSSMLADCKSLSGHWKLQRKRMRATKDKQTSTRCSLFGLDCFRKIKWMFKRRQKSIWWNNFVKRRWKFSEVCHTPVPLPPYSICLEALFQFMSLCSFNERISSLIPNSAHIYNSSHEPLLKLPFFTDARVTRFSWPRCCHWCSNSSLLRLWCCARFVRCTIELNRT